MQVEIGDIQSSDKLPSRLVFDSKKTFFQNVPNIKKKFSLLCNFPNQILSSSS